MNEGDAGCPRGFKVHSLLPARSWFCGAQVDFAMQKGWRGRYLSRMTESVTRSHKVRPVQSEGRPRLFPYGLIDAQPVSQKANLLRLAKAKPPAVPAKAPEAVAPAKHASWYYVKK